MKKILLLAAGIFMFAGMAEAHTDTDSLSMRTGMTDWTDPVHATPVNTRYVLYPTPSRGEGTQGSCMVYLPDGYDASRPEPYPVIYYLHGGTGNQREASWLINEFHKAIAAKTANPVIIVSPQALPIGWYVNANTSDSKVISGPIEDVIIKDLIPFIDAEYNTVAAPAGRGIEGFSMGGRGALALAFSHPDLFGAVSSVAGAVVEWNEEPLQRALECTFGDVNDEFSRTYFNALHPKTAACRNAREIIARGMHVRMAVGDRDRLYDENGNHITENFHNILLRLGIPHTLTVVPGADHNPAEIFDPAVNPYDVSFWNTAFATTKLPEEIMEFVHSHFPKDTVESAEVTQEANGDHYLLSLSDGISLKFNEHFNWIQVHAVAGGALIPDSMILPDIRTYLNSKHPGADVLSIVKVPRTGYDIMLSDGTKLLFDTKGKIIND